jgi:hypothetical protein
VSWVVCLFGCVCDRRSRFFVSRLSLSLSAVPDELGAPGISNALFELHVVMGPDMHVVEVQPMLDYEHGTCLAELAINVGPMHPPDVLLAAGTGFIHPQGEDKVGHGRLLVYRVHHDKFVGNTAEPTPGDATPDDQAEDSDEEEEREVEIRPRLELIYSKELKQAAVTAVAQLQNYILIAMGSKVCVCEGERDWVHSCMCWDGTWS